MRAHRKKLWLTLTVVAVVALIAGACNTGGGGGGDKGTVNVAVNPWVGYEANAAVVGVLLEKLGYTVNKKALKEEISWQGFETGEVDVILENWGHPDLEKTYIEEKKVAQDAGLTGNVGIIGWFVPPWMVEEYPDITDWNNLNKYAELFKTSESGDKGQFLASDPTFVQNDEAIIENLGLDYKVVFSGSEAASITAFQTAEEQKKPLLGYFYDPQWLLSQVPLVQIPLPPYSDECYADPKKIACDYPKYDLNKIVSTKFATEGGDAFTLIKNFNWTNADQNIVANYITNDGMTPEEAGKKWVDENEAKWSAWMP